VYDLAGADWASGDGYTACAGPAQSPVDLPALPASAPTAPPLLAFPDGARTWAIVSRPRGHPGFELKPVVPTAALNLTLPDSRVFSFSQFHFHASSEHTIAGAALPLELHMVFTGVTNSSATTILAILFNSSSVHNAAFDSFFWEIYRSQELQGVSLAALLEGVNPVYWRYEGSYTTPPCVDGVTWMVFVSQHGVNPVQMLSFTYALNGIKNARVTQPLNGRVPAAFSL
jgi:carbonic anhydrase